MKYFTAALVLGTALLTGAGAQAAIVKYAYTAKVGTILERDGAADTYTYVNQSGFGGASVAVGDVLSGFIQYDTSAKLSSYQPASEPGKDYRIYAAGSSDYITYVDQNTSMAFESMLSWNMIGTTSILDSAPVANGYASDYFSMTRAAVDDTMIRDADLWLHDLYGNAFRDTAIPAQLNLASFQFASISGSFIERNSSNWMQFSANLTALEQVEVPEPNGASLFAVAGLALFGLIRKRS